MSEGRSTAHPQCFLRPLGGRETVGSLRPRPCVARATQRDAEIAISTSFGCRRDSKPDSPATSKACFSTEARHTEADTLKPRNEFHRGRAAQLRASKFHRGLSFEVMFVTLLPYELHASRGRTVSRSADPCTNPALPDIRIFVPTSRRRSRHANTDSGSPRTLAMLLDGNRPRWMALPSGQAQRSRFGARLVPVSRFKGLAAPC